ncbi:MAG: phospholipase C, phosphocholine-specific [Bacteroidota bacterium]
MDTRRSFLKKASILSGAGWMESLPPSIRQALSIDPAAGSSFEDAEHIVLLMQENRSFDHTFGTLQGVRGFNDPRAITKPDGNKVWMQTNKAGETFAPWRLNIKDTRVTWMGCLPHSWDDQVDAFNEGKHDRWLDVKRSGEKDFKGLPMTMGHYNRQDIPFYYSLADAFTVCDQNFCSSLTGTTPNRLHFWTGTIRDKQEPAAQANVWNGDADYSTLVNYKTYPERLEENGISWKVYQNEISSGVGLEGEADGWLTNFGDNPLEYFTQYKVKLSREYIANLPMKKQTVQKEIAALETALSASTGETGKAAATKKLAEKKAWLEQLVKEEEIYTIEKYNALSTFEKNIHDKAFTNNREDPAFHQLTPHEYQDGAHQRTLNIPKGDVFHQFREDVNKGTLPTVSWLVAPQYFSDHPDSPWFGAWYVSEAMDILTSNPEVWKKTIFILTYDENDGYYDHVPPFVAPNPYKEGTGKASTGIDTKLEFVTKEQQSRGNRLRESPIGLGFRVPMIIASPWTRGGYVCSEVFDHTSSLQFLEKFLEKKAGKKIKETQINEWRRTVCGDLSSAFRPYNGEQLQEPAYLDREKSIEGIHQASFKSMPSNFHAMSTEEIGQVNKGLHIGQMPVQEKGTRPACPLPYELYVDGNMDKNSPVFSVNFKAGNNAFEAESSGSPFTVYSVSPYEQTNYHTRNYAVKAGQQEQDSWHLEKFTSGNYHLRVHAPNGFYREFKGTAKDPRLKVWCQYENGKLNSKKLTGNIVLRILNEDTKPMALLVTDNSYKAGRVERQVAAGKELLLVLNQQSSFNWYDVSVAVKGVDGFEKRFAGHVETGAVSKTDPLMGQVV